MVDIAEIDVIAPNFKKRLSGVTSTIVRLVPVQARAIRIAAWGPLLPDTVPQVRLRDLLLMSREGPSGARVWHARRNSEMLLGVLLKHLLGKRLKLLFTSASQRVHSSYTKWLIRRMDWVVATSQRSARYLSVSHDVIRHGIDADIYVPAADKRDVRRRLGLPENGTLIGYVGRIREQKGADLFVDAMLRVLPSHPSAHAILLGGITAQHRPFADTLQSKIDGAGLTDRCCFVPEVPEAEVLSYFQALDLYIAPQRWEGFGLTPLEAMACAVPVIAARVGAFEELIVDGETGVLVDIADLNAITRATERLVSDDTLRATWSQAARARVVSQFQLQGEADALIAVYCRLLGIDKGVSDLS